MPRGSAGPGEGKGGGGGTSTGAGIGRPLGPGVLGLPTIIAAAAAAAAAAATQGYAATAAAASPSVAASAPLARVISPLKLLYLLLIYGVAADADISRIWIEACRAPTKADALVVLSQYLWDGREVCQRDFFGSKEMLHFCRSLFMFVHGDRFVNPKKYPDCPIGGVCIWTTRQGSGNTEENIASKEGTITSLDGANARHEEVMNATRTKLAVVVGPLKTATDMGTHAYVLHYLLGGASPVVEATPPPTG